PSLSVGGSAWTSSARAWCRWTSEPQPAGRHVVPVLRRAVGGQHFLHVVQHLPHLRGEAVGAAKEGGPEAGGRARPGLAVLDPAAVVVLPLVRSDAALAGAR